MTIQLGLRESDITGTWDPAHLMQIIFAEVLKEHPKVQLNMKLLFDVMKRFNMGKSGSHFEEIAKELGHHVVHNQSYQEAKFV